MSIFLKNLDLSKIKGQHRRSSNNNRSHSTSFPVKLYQMLEAAELEGNEHIVSWHPDGLSFQVHNPEKFVEIVLPSHFKQTKYKSFQRQLNFYGFQRITSGPLEGSYKHPSFVKGNKPLCTEIKRQTQQTTKSGTAVSNHDQGSDYDSSSESSEPDIMQAEKASPEEHGVEPIAVTLVEQPENGGSITSAPQMDSYYQPNDTFPSFEPKRRSSFVEGTRLSFVGRNFHFLAVEFTDLYGL